MTAEELINDLSVIPSNAKVLVRIRKNVADRKLGEDFALDDLGEYREAPTLILIYDHPECVAIIELDE